MVIQTVDLSPAREIPSATVDDTSTKEELPIVEIDDKSALKTITAVLENESSEIPQDNNVNVTTNDNLDEEIPPRSQSKNDNYITVKIKDFSGVLEKTEAQLFVFTTDTTFADIFVDVSCRFDIELGEFDIIFQDKSFSYNLGGLPDDQTLTSLGIVPDCDRTYWMSLDIFPQKKRKSRDSIKTGLEPVSENDNASSHTSDACSTFGGKRDFVGLKNRNMTCYLNSFLQGLWFTPEFRNALYNYVYEPGRSNRKSLCHPLQKLFLQQQFSIRDSIETDELIRTFGWEDRETWNQHDIEELCSIFMENLTAEFKGTSLDGIIQALYFGSLDDYVKCLECGRVSQRTDDFLVIPLPIRNFGSLLANPTLEAALNSFVAYEILDGNNMYNCSQCEKPCPAHKGLKFNRLPYILTIQLKRFEYDFIKDRRLKLNDRVAFPYVLDMNSYIETPSPDRREGLKIDMLYPGSMKVENGRSSHSRPSISLVDPEDNEEPSQSEEGAAGGEKPILEQMTELRNTKGPEIYQLYGVMVHRGGINSGHYYAYIMDFERGKWFRCDDAAVRKVTRADIEGAYGGDSDEDKELTSAYMLLYRRFDPDLNLLPYYLNDMPPHLQDMWNATCLLDKACHEEEELAKNTVRMPCLFRDPETNPTLQEKMVAIPKTLTMDEAANFVFKELFPKAEQVPEEGMIRLCRYDKDLDIIENSFDNCEHMFIVTAIRHRPPVTKNEALLLERKDPKLEFDIYRHNDYIFRTSMIDCLKQDLLQVDEIHASPTETVEELMKKVQTRFSITDPITLVANYMSRYCTILGEKHPLSLFKFDRVNNLYFQAGVEEGLSDVMLDFVEQYTRAEIIEIHVQTPPNVGEGNASSEEKAAVIATDTNVTTPVDTKNVVATQVQPDAVKESSSSKTGESAKATNETKTPTPSKADKVTVAAASGTPETVKATNETKTVDAAVSVNGIAPPSSNDTSMDGNAPQAPKADSDSADKPTGIKALAQKNGHYMKFMNKSETAEEGVYVYTLRIDGQTPLYALSKRVSQLINTNESNFVIYKIDGNETTELRRMTERICTIKPIDRLFVKLEHRLQDGESRLAVCLLNVGCIDKPSEYLTDIVVTLKMSVDEVKSAILKKSEALQNDTNVDASKMRIRKKLRSSPSKIMRSKSKLQDIFTVTSIQTGEVFLQLLDSPCELTDQNYCFIYRHWHPSTGVLDATVEVTVFHDHSESLEDVILSKIRESLGVTNEVELEAAKPDGHYPWNVSPRLIQDLGWFSLSPPVKKSLYVYNDELVLFVRDKNEAPKEFYEYQSETSIPTTVRRTVSSIAEAPRREPGLKLNLAQSPPQN